MAIVIHGHQVEGDPEGIRYLHALSENEVKTLFKEALDQRVSYFQYRGKHFEIAREGSTGGFFSSAPKFIIAETRKHPQQSSSIF